MLEPTTLQTPKMVAPFDLAISMPARVSAVSLTVLRQVSVWVVKIFNISKKTTIRKAIVLKSVPIGLLLFCQRFSRVQSGFLNSCSKQVNSNDSLLQRSFISEKETTQITPFCSGLKSARNRTGFLF